MPKKTPITTPKSLLVIQSGDMDAIVQLDGGSIALSVDIRRGPNQVMALPTEDDIDNLKAIAEAIPRPA